MGVLAATGRVVLSVLVLVLLLGAWPAVVVTHRTSRSLGGRAAGIAPLPARPAAPPRPDVAWAQARSRFDRLCAEYAAYECDPISVLRLPALADVTVPSTGRFVEALAEAQALETDAFPGPDAHATGFVAAVERADRAWRAARAAAERIRLSGLSPTERGTVERVIKLLTTARDSDSDAERVAAYSRARSELAKLDRAGVVQVPRPAQAALHSARAASCPPNGTGARRHAAKRTRTWSTLSRAHDVALLESVHIPSAPTSLGTGMLLGGLRRRYRRRRGLVVTASAQARCAIFRPRSRLCLLRSQRIR